MKKGVILYVTGGGEDIPLHDLGTIPFGILRRGIAAAHVATSEDELVYWWWYMTTRGHAPRLMYRCNIRRSPSEVQVPC